MAGCGGACACSPLAAAASIQTAKGNAIPSSQKINVMDVIEDDGLRKLLDDYFSNDARENLEKYQKEIFQSYKSVYFKNTLVRIVETLSFALTDINVEKRAKGTGLLAECIFQCSPGSMDELEVDTLMRFFCDRLKDHHSIQPIVIYAFLGLSSYQNVRNELIISMLQGIFSEVHIQSLLQADRRNVFNIFSNLLKTKVHILETFSSDFVFGFIQAMDSERDPRNLLLCFENSLLVIRDLDIKLFAEDFFEILSCYFPVEFREPKEDQFRIKKEDLVISLRKCLTGTPLFGPYAVPLYLEKLSSDLIDSKLDALITFTECLEIYNGNDIALHIDDIWLTIRKDYLLSDFGELASPYLHFLYQLVKCLSKLDDPDPLMKVVDFLIKDCSQTLKDPEMAIAIPCANVILQVSNASEIMYNEIINKLISSLQSSLEKYTSVLQRTSIMEIVTKLFCVENPNITASVLLIQFVDYLLPLLYNVISNCEDIKLQVLCLRCLEHIVAKSSWFEHCDFDILAHHCLSPVQESILAADLLIEYKLFVEILSHHFPMIFKKRYLEFLENNFVNKLEKEVLSQYLDLLPCTSFKNKDLIEDIYGYLNDFITLISDVNFQHCEDVLQCYINVLRKSGGTIDGKLFVLPLINTIKCRNFPENLLVKICAALSESFKPLSIQQSKEFCLFAYNILTGEGNANQSLFDFSSIILNFDDDSVKLSFLLRGVLTQIKPCDLYEMDVDNMCKELLQAMKKTIDARALENLGVVFGSIINKLPSESPLIKKYIEVVKETMLADNPCHYKLVMLSWFTKALTLNWQSSTTIAIDTMLVCLKTEAIASVCSAGFDIIVRDVEYVFTKQSNAVLKPVYKQRYTEYVVPLLIAQYHTGGEEVKSFHMMAISSTLQAIPRRMLTKHLKSMMPLLMHSLATCDTTQITESTLTTIFSLLGQSKDDVLDYVPSLISRLLHLVTHNSMNIRILSLASLTILSSYTSHVVLPMKTDVVRKVHLVLDDQKRLVRKEAIRCSNAWHLMTSDEK